MKKLLLFGLGIVGALLLPGCETTGDPNHGGIFWSEDKAKQRLSDRQQELNDVESDTSRVNRHNRQLEQEAQ